MPDRRARHRQASAPPSPALPWRRWRRQRTKRSWPVARSQPPRKWATATAKLQDGTCTYRYNWPSQKDLRVLQPTFTGLLLIQANAKQHALHHPGQVCRWRQDLAIVDAGRNRQPRAEELIDDALARATVARAVRIRHARLAANRDAHRHGHHPAGRGLISVEKQLDDVAARAMRDPARQQARQWSTNTSQPDGWSTTSGSTRGNVLTPIVCGARNGVGQYRVGGLNLLECVGRFTARTIRMPPQGETPPGAPQLRARGGWSDAEQRVVVVHRRVKCCSARQARAPSAAARSRR